MAALFFVEGVTVRGRSGLGSAVSVERSGDVAEAPLRDVLALNEGEDEVVVQIPPPAPPGSPAYLARRLKSVERRLLDGALAVLARRGAAEVLP